MVDALQLREFLPAEPVEVLSLRQKRQSLLVGGRARIGRAEEFESQPPNEQDEGVVEFPLARAALDLSLVPANPDQMNLVRIEVPIRDFDRVGG